MNKSIIISGSNGPERNKIFVNLIDEAIKNNDGNIIIYDATYGLISYQKYSNVKYFSVDTVNPYLSLLHNIVNSNDKTYIFSDAYAALMLSNENVELFKKFLDKDNFSIIFNARHLSFIKDELIKKFVDIKELDDCYTVLSNDYNKNKN